MEPERIELMRLIQTHEIHYICAVCALVGELPPPSVLSKPTRKRAIKCLRESNCWNGTMTQEDIERAVRLLRAPKEEVV